METNDAELVTAWLEGRSRHTRSAYIIDTNRLLNVTGTPLHAVTSADLKRYVRHLQASSLAGASRQRALSAARSLVKYAYHAGVVPGDLSHWLRLPGPARAPTVAVLTVAEIERLIRATGSRRNQLPIQLLNAAALRTGEVCAHCHGGCIKFERRT